MALTKKDKKEIKNLLKDDFEEIKRHNDVLYEKFQDDIKTLGEGIGINREKIEENKDLIKYNADKIEVVFEEVGEIKEDMEIVKQDISFIKQELRKKADQEDLDSLEKRVILLEKKVNRA